MNDQAREPLSLPPGFRNKRRFDVGKGGGKPPRKEFKPRGHQATLDANIGKEVTIAHLGGNVVTAKLLASDAYTITIEGDAEHDAVIFKHSIAALMVSKAKTEAAPPNV